MHYSVLRIRSLWERMSEGIIGSDPQERQESVQTPGYGTNHPATHDANVHRYSNDTLVLTKITTYMRHVDPHSLGCYGCLQLSL